MDISLIEYDSSLNPTDKYQRYFLSGLLSGVGQIASSIIGGKMQQKAAEQQFEYQQQLNQQQNDFTEKMWNQTNDYNKAENVLQRYLDTGMSTGAAVQAMSGVQGIAGNVQASSSPGVNVDYASGINAGSNAFGGAISSSIQSILSGKQAEGLDIDNATKRMELEYKPRYIKLQLDNMSAQTNQIFANIDNIISNTKLTESKTEGQNIENEFAPQEKQSQLSLNTAQYQQIKTSIQEMYNNMRVQWNNMQINGMDASTRRFDVQTRRMFYSLADKMSTYQIDLMKQQGINLDASSQKLLSDAVLNAAKGDLTKAQTIYQEFDNDLRSSNPDLYKSREKLENMQKIINLFVPISQIGRSN